MRHSGPQFRIVHRFHQPQTNCLPGEEIALISLVHRGRECPLRLPLSLRILFDYLARQRRLPQSAGQIEAGIHSHTFYLKHGANAGKKQLRRIGRSTVKEYVKRIRYALMQAFEAACISVDPNRVLVSEKTTGNEVLYRLRANVNWEHKE